MLVKGNLLRTITKQQTKSQTRVISRVRRHSTFNFIRKDLVSSYTTKKYCGFDWPTYVKRIEAMKIYRVLKCSIPQD